MRSDVRLDYAIFQLTPTRTRCELLVAVGNYTEKLASGLLQPFVTHLKAAEEQIATGGYSIRLEPRPGFGDADPQDAPWFTKGTMERFVRFVSTPEILERVSTVSAELSQIEEDISNQANESSRVDTTVNKSLPTTPPSANKVLLSPSMEKPGTTPKSRRDSLDGGDTPEAPDSSKRRLLRAIDARRMMLQKELGMAFARAAAAGFDMPHMSHLLVFADCFGATRLRDATLKYMALCKKRQEAGLWIEEMELAAAEAATAPRLVPVNLEGSFLKPSDTSWPQPDGEFRGDEFQDDASIQSHGGVFPDGRGLVGEDLGGRGHSRPDFLQRRRSAPPVGQANGNTRSPNRMEMDGDYWSRGHSLQVGVDDYHDQEGAERSYAEDGSFPGNGAGSRWPPALSPPPQNFPPTRYAGESGHELGERGPHSRRSWATNPSHSLPTHYASGPPYRGNSNTVPHLHESDRDYHLDSRLYHSQTAQAGYHPNQPPYVDGNGGQGMWPQPQMQDQHWRSGSGYIEGPRYGHPGEVQGPYRQNSEPGSGYNHMMSASERNANTIEVAGQGPSGTDLVVSDQDSVSPPDQESHSPSRKIVRHLAPRSPSPKRRSPSPLRRVRPGARRSMVVIRNINYIASKQGENGDKDANEKESDVSESVDETDAALDDEDDRRSGSLSVKDAISLFEVKKRDSNDGSKKRRSKHGSRRGSTDSTASSVSEKPVLRRWSNTGDLSRGSSTISKSDFVEDNGESQKVTAKNTDIWSSREAHALPKPYDGGEEALILPARTAQPSHSGVDLGSEAAGLSPINRPARASGAEVENAHFQSQGDDSFMIPDRLRRNDISSSRIVSQDNFELIQAEMPKVSGDSFIVPARPSRNEQSGSGWNLQFESEMAEEQQTTPQNEPAPHDLFMLPDRRDALGWSTAVDHSTENVIDASEQKVLTPGGKPGMESPKEHKGRLYEQYREKRDAKLRGEPGSKKAERDAKLKAMQDVLEKRKAEMTSRSGRMTDKHAPTVDAQLRAEKLRAFKADLARTKKEKDEEERKRLEEMRSQRRERIAARSSPASGPTAKSATATPRASLRSSMTKPIPMQKLVSPQKAANGSSRSSITSLSPIVPRTSRLTQRRGSPVPSTPGNPLSRSVPSLAELRKENTKPPSLRSSIHDRALFTKGTTTPAVRASSAPLEANNIRPVRRAATVINDDKKRQSVATRKSLSALNSDSSEKGLKTTSLRKPLTSEQNGTTKPARRLSMNAVATPEAKPFLRKGRALAPIAGPGVRKLKETSPLEQPKNSEENLNASQLRRDTPKYSQESPASLVTDESDQWKAKGPIIMPAQVPTSTDYFDSNCSPPSVSEPPHMNEMVGEQSQSTNLDQVPDPSYIVHIEDYASPPGLTTSTSYNEKHSGVHEVQVTEIPNLSTSSPTKAPTESVSGAHHSRTLSQSPAVSPSPAVQQHEVQVPGTPGSPPEASSVSEVAYDAPIATISSSSNVYEAPTGASSTTPSASPVVESYPILQASLSPEAANANTGKSRKKWGSSQKVEPRANSVSKEEPKGLRKLLNFGRKSRSSLSNTNDAVSASTTSEGNGSFEVTSDTGSSHPTKSFEQRSKVGVHGSTKPAKSSKSTKSSRNASVMRDSISKDVDVDVDVDDRSAPAHRSFFSLSSFRSKGSESKSRS